VRIEDRTLPSEAGATSPDVLGRRWEIAAIDTLIGARETLPAGLELRGEPGVGKTTLWRHGVDGAHAAGYRVMQAEPAHAEIHLAHAGLRDLLGACFDEVSPELAPPQRRALAVALLREDLAIAVQLRGRSRPPP
jgi:hypothetical protein